MGCKDLLALILDECNRRPRKRKRSSSRQKRAARGSSALRAGESHPLREGDGASSSAVLASGAELLALIPRKRDRIYVDRNPKVRLKIMSKGKSSRQGMQQVVNARRFNASGRAIRRDSMIFTEKVGKVKGQGKWRKWQPEAIQRGVFTKISSRSFAQSNPARGKATFILLRRLRERAGADLAEACPLDGFKLPFFPSTASFYFSYFLCEDHAIAPGGAT